MRPIRALLALIAAAVVAAVTMAAVRFATDDSRRDYLADTGWPRHGQAAYVLGAATPAASPGQRPAPIASLAKVMTAYVVLHRFPARRAG